MPGVSVPFSAHISSAKSFQSRSVKVYGGGCDERTDAIDDITTTAFRPGPAWARALASSVFVPAMAACKIGTGSVKDIETGDARCAIAVTSTTT
jgi:hypothetical protein